MEHYGDSPTMNSKKDLFPPEIVNAMNCLTVDTRQNILSALLNNLELSFTEIEKIGFTGGNLTHHLPIMMKAGLIEKHIRQDSQDPFDSFYSVTQFGRDFVSGIFESMKPVKEKSADITKSSDIAKSFRIVVMERAGIKQIQHPSSTGISGDAFVEIRVT